MIDRVIEVGWPCSFTGHIPGRFPYAEVSSIVNFCRNNRRMAN